MADALIAERVKDAYLRPIRTVLAVDDDFHQYDAKTPGRDPERAKAIWRACRNRGLLCDIDDGSDLVNGSKTGHLLLSDLVILDYHLRGEEPIWSLGLLRQLADSEHASLVVVYTRDANILSVRRAISAHLMGVKAKDQWFSEVKLKDRSYSKEDIAEFWGRIEEKLREVLTEELIDAYIQGDMKRCRSDKPIQEILKDHEIPGAAFTQVIDALFATALIIDYGVEPGSPSDKPRMLGGHHSTPWVYANNLFVVCVVKTPENTEDGDLVFKELEKALGEWNPDFMKASVAFARGEFARGGFDHERSSLSDPCLQAGWLYHAWAGSDEEREGRLRVLFERIIRSYAGKVLDKVIEFGSRHIPPYDLPEANRETLKAAIGHLCQINPPSETRVLHVLNEYLATENRPKHVETGTIFVQEGEGITKGFVYLCVTPACDLVPRPPKRGWEKQMHPMRPMIAMRCRINDMAVKNLEIAEQSRYIFLTVDNKQKTVILQDDDNPVPALEWFIMHNMGKIDGDDTFKAVRFDYSERDTGGAVTTIIEPMKVLGQIRSIYANRILQAAGQHMSRIGVDFVNLPKLPDEKEAKTEVKPAPRSEASAASHAEQATARAASLTAIPAAKTESGAPAKTDLPPPPPVQV